MEDNLLWKTAFDGRQVVGHIGRQAAGRLQAGLQAGWPGRCITLPLAVRRYGVYRQVGRRVGRQVDKHARISIASFEPARGRLQKLVPITFGSVSRHR